MAINIVSQPRSGYQPAYNPLVWVFDSNLKSSPSFRYIVEIWKAAPPIVKVAELKLAPRNGDGYGYVDISGIVKNYVDKSFPPLNGIYDSDFDAGTNTAWNYFLIFGEEYLYNINYLGVINVGGFMTFVTSGPHGLNTTVIGSSIQATNNNQNYTNSLNNINGFWTIKDLTASNQIQTTTPWGVATGRLDADNCPGNMVFANRKTTRNLSPATPIQTVLNVALSLDQYKDYIDAAVSPFTDNSAAGQLMTNMPQTTFTATLDQYAYLHVLNRPVTTNAQWVYFTNSNGDVLRRNFTGTLQDVKAFAVGPGNFGTLTAVSGSLPLIKSDTTWYDVQIRNNNGSWVSQTYRFNLDRRCAINPIQILFMDRKSSWLSYAFQLRQTENIETIKSQYRKEIPKTLTPSWVTLDRADAGTTTFHSRFIKKFELNSNWMNDAMSVYFEELLTSPYTYINWGDGKWYSVQVEPGTYETLRYKNERLIRKTITVYKSIEDPIQDASTITPFIGLGYNLSDGFVEAGQGDIIIPIGDVPPAEG
jgi:hypothetical protein